MKKMISLIIPVVALFTVLLIPYSFIYQGQVRDVLDSVLHVKVDPVISGGEILAKFMDPMDDDYGEGTLTYPRHGAFDGKGYLDVVRYTVYEPVVNSQWSGEPDFQQLGITLANTGNPLEAPLGLSHPVIHIYIDLDGDKGGSTETATPRAELVTFDRTHPWDFMVHIEPYNKKGFIVSHDKTYKKPVRLYYVEKKKTIYARIALEDRRLKQILDGRVTYHYVLVGAYDRLARGHFMAVKETAGMGNGGGAPSRLSPRVYDWVEPPGGVQKKYLSSYDEANYTYAGLVPLEVKKSVTVEDRTDVDLLVMYKKRLEEEKKNRKPVDHAARLEKLKAEGVEGMELAKAYFEAGEYDKAEAIFRRELETGSSSAGALTFLGTISAVKAGRAESVSGAFGYVNKAFGFYEKAVGGCKTDVEMVELLLHRGNVSLSVPEDVFQKTEEGIGDFLKVVEIVERGEERDLALILECYYKAAMGYERMGKPEEAEIYFTKLTGYRDLPTSIIVELLERGYNPVNQN